MVQALWKGQEDGGDTDSGAMWEVRSRRKCRRMGEDEDHFFILP